MPTSVTITAEPSGSVVARGGDSLANSLLTHAGFAFTHDWHGPRHRLPTSMARADQAAIASHAAQMLCAARYTVDLDPLLDTSRSSTTPGTYGQPLEDHLLRLTDRIQGTRSGAELRDVVGELLDPDCGVVERVREAREAVGEQIGDLDDEAYVLADRFTVAAEFLTAAQGELIDVDRELTRIGRPEPQSGRPTARGAALTASPAAGRARSARTGTAAVTGSKPASRDVATAPASRSRGR